ncbi:MAG: alpha/beta fold hydrolase [Betaproteobacteria bacterium]|nr:alpha/beta fold hydrolase [Betaproteobacteria bacterium]
MTLETSDHTSTEHSSTAGSKSALADFPQLTLLGRESKLTQLHEKYFQPFYSGAEILDFEASRNVILSARCWRHQRSHSTLLIVGGRNESHAKYAEVAYDFFTRGFDVWIYDHRGQGFSQRELVDTQVGWVDSFQNYVNDLSIFHDRILAPHKKNSLFLLAHSMGAAVSTLWMNQTRVRLNAVAFTAPMVDLLLKPYPRVVVNMMVAAGLRAGREKEYIPGGTAFEPSDYGFDLTNSAARRDWNRSLFISYPQIRLGSPSYRWLHEALQVARKMRSSGFVGAMKTPLLVWQAGADQVVKPNAHRYLRYFGENCELAVERRSQHELLQEHDDIRARVIDRTVSFFEKAASSKE